MRTIDKINYYLSKQGKNGAALCEFLGVSSGVYSQWNTGRTSPRKSKLPLIAEYLGVSVDDLMPDENIKKEAPIPTDEELAKNDAMWETREEVLQRFSDLSLQDFNKLVNPKVGGEDATLGEMFDFFDIYWRLSPERRAFLKTSAKALWQEQSKS